MSDNTFDLGAGSSGVEAPVDLSALRGPAGASGAARWEALAARIERAAAPELTRRAAQTRDGGAVVFDLVPLLARALRPALLAAAAALALAVGLGRGAWSAAGTAESGDVAAGQLVGDASVARALRVADNDAVWLAEGASPSRDALASAIGLAADDATAEGAGAP